MSQFRLIQLKGIAAAAAAVAVIVALLGAGLWVGVASVGCDVEVPPFPAGQGQKKAAISYPGGPYGVTKSSVITNFTFPGFPDPGTSKDPNALVDISLSDFYNPTGDAVYEAGTVYEVLAAICAAGRASFTMKNGLFSVVRDVVHSTPAQHFTPVNSWGYRGRKAFAGSRSSTPRSSTPCCRKRHGSPRTCWPRSTARATRKAAPTRAAASARRGASRRLTPGSAPAAGPA